jgi:hypothetical protein
MPPVNDFNVGSDTTISIINSGTIMKSSILTSFEARQITASLKSTAIDGVNRYDEIEQGWEGTLDFDRADSILDDFFAAKEVARYAGNTLPTISITETTTNVDGTVVKYRYPRCALKFDTIGARKGDSKVEERVSWKSGRRIKVQ